jgi:hypothetical protein
MLIAGVLVGALAVTATFLGIVWRYGGQSDAVEISAASPAIRPAAEFTVVYRVEDTAGPQARVQTITSPCAGPSTCVSSIATVRRREGPSSPGAS